MNDNAAADNSAFSSENILNRLSAARDRATIEANRLFLASLVFDGLYLIKASGLRVDLTLLDTRVASVPYGVFFFLVASQVSIILAYMRTSDQTALDVRVRNAISAFRGSDADQCNDTFVNESEWFAITESEFKKTILVN